MKRIFTFFSLLISAQVFAEAIDTNFTPTDQHFIDTVNQTYASITFNNDISTSNYMCPNVTEVRNAAKTMKPGDSTYFKDSQQLTWEIDIPSNITDTTLVGFYSAEYQNNFVTCSYQIANTNLAIDLQGIFYIAKPMLAPWMGAPDSKTPNCTAGQTQCIFQLLKNPTDNSTPTPASSSPSTTTLPPSYAPRLRTTPTPPPDPTSSIPMPGEITG